MRLRRPLFAIFALAVFVVSLGTGAAVGYGHAAAGVAAIRPAGAGEIPGGTRTGANNGPSTAVAATVGPGAASTADPTASNAGASPFPARTPTATWPLVAAGWRSITAAELAADLASGIQPRPRTFVITFDDGRSDGYTQAFPMLRRLGLVATFYVITGRIGDSNSLSASQLQGLAAAGMEIESHTVNHVLLTAAIPSAARLQLTRSAAQIAAVTGQRPTTFAYPYGGVSPLEQALVRETGHAMAFTVVEGCRMSWPTRLAAPRVRVSPGTSPNDLLHELDVCTAGG